MGDAYLAEYDDSQGHWVPFVGLVITAPIKYVRLEDVEGFKEGDRVASKFHSKLLTGTVLSVGRYNPMWPDLLVRIHWDNGTKSDLRPEDIYRIDPRTVSYGE